MEDDNELMKKIKLKIAISEIKKENEIAMKNKKSLISKKIGIGICACLVFTTGIVFAKDIETYFKGLFTNSTEAIDKATENGYVQKEEMDYVYNKDIGIKVDNLVLDDLSLDVSFNFEARKENIKSIKINQYTISTENNVLIYEYINKGEAHVGLAKTMVYMGETEKIAERVFNNSVLFELRQEKNDFSELYFDIKSLRLIYNDNNSEIIDGHWNFNVIINDEMRKRNNIHYNLAESNEYVESCSGTLYKTGMIVELKFREPINLNNVMTTVTPNISELFCLKNNDNIYMPEYMEGIYSDDYSEDGVNGLTIHYSNIGEFYDNIDKIELYLKLYDTTIVLERN